jgi:hypothetical protein
MIQVLFYGLIAAVLSAAGGAWYGYDHGRQVERTRTQLESLDKLVEAKKQETEWREAYVAANALYVGQQQAILLADRGLRELGQRMRDRTPTAADLSRHSAQALGRYAEGAERDLDRCADLVGRLAGEAAGAAAAARSLDAGFPAKPAPDGPLKLLPNKAP